MVGILILTHGRMAIELLAAASKIAGELERFEALTLDWDEAVEEARRKVEASVERLDSGDGVLILTDIFGGTPSNIAMQLAEPDRVEVVSGVNLPMVVRLGCQRSSWPAMPLDEMTSWIEDKGKSSICSSRSAVRPQKVGC